MSKIIKYSDYINELYLYFDIDYVDVKSIESRVLVFLLCLFFVSPILLLVSLVYSFFLVLFPRAVINQPVSADKICVARTFATKNKLSFLKKEGVVFFNESPFSLKQESNLYNIPLRHRFIALLFAIKKSFADVYFFSVDLVRFISLSKLISVFLIYLPRVPHKINFEAYLDQLVSYYKPVLIFTGNKEDRFALVEEGVSNYRKIDLICYPHGLEYALKLPRGVVGNKFYCYSDAARKHYSKIYKKDGQSFIFDSVIVKNLLCKGSDVISHIKRVVFFPESRDKQVNYKIVSSILDCSISLFIKLHPLDTADEYIKLGIDPNNIIDSFDEAITGNIVLARKSTVLLEALYSGSESCALLFDDSDYQKFMSIFPSLWDERIAKVRNSEELVAWLEKVGINQS